MSDVKQTIQVTNTGLSPILSIAQGTGMVDFEFTISDFQIPAGSTAVAWNIQPTGNIVSQVCTLVGNVITVTPPAYYFLRGKNYMQIQVTGASGVNLFTFLIEAWCSPNISTPVVSQNPDLISQLMAMIGNTQDLDTTAKNNLVAAINEIYARGVVDILDTEEEIEANTDAGKATGALVTKRLISELKFPDGTKFYPDIQDGEYGFNTAADRGADTFHPFSGIKKYLYKNGDMYNDVTGGWIQQNIFGQYGKVTFGESNITIEPYNGSNNQVAIRTINTINTGEYKRLCAKISIKKTLQYPPSLQFAIGDQSNSISQNTYAAFSLHNEITENIISLPIVTSGYIWLNGLADATRGGSITVDEIYLEK